MCRWGLLACLSMIFHLLCWLSREVSHIFLCTDYQFDESCRTLLATIKYLAKCPCPQCLVEKSNISELGTRSDMESRRTRIWCDTMAHKRKVERVRRLIYKCGMNLGSATVGKVLAPESLVPTQVCIAFRSTMLADKPVPECLFGMAWISPIWISLHVCSRCPPWVWTWHVEENVCSFNAVPVCNRYWCDPTPQPMVWSSLHFLNTFSVVCRYRLIPTFGCDTIWKFSNNASGMSKLAGHDFENLLQVICVFHPLLRFTDGRYSAVFQYLKVFSLNHIIQLLSHYYLN